MAEGFEHARLDDGVLIQCDEPFIAEGLCLVAELIECRSDTEVRGVLYQDHAVGQSTDISNVLRTVIDDDQGCSLGCCLQVLLQADDIGLVGDDADGVIHILICLSGEDAFESLENARSAADEFAKNSHSKIGKMRTASQGYFEVDDLDENTPQIKKVRVVTTVEYYLK